MGIKVVTLTERVKRSPLIKEYTENDDTHCVFLNHKRVNICLLCVHRHLPSFD